MLLSEGNSFAVAQALGCKTKRKDMNTLHYLILDIPPGEYGG